jgi:hypothetical protein
MFRQNKMINNELRRLRMKRLLTMAVIFALLAVCSASDAYTLVYKLSSPLKTVETNTDVAANFKVSGFLAMDIDDDLETVGDARMVIYGKDGDANLIYYIEDFSGGASIDWTEEGAYLTLEITITHAIFNYDLRFTGKVKEKDVGFGSDVNDLRSAPPSLKGSMFCTHGELFDLDQDLFGSGTATLTLDIKKTKVANDVTPATLDDIMTDIVDGENGLVEKGYQALTLP